MFGFLKYYSDEELAKIYKHCMKEEGCVFPNGNVCKLRKFSNCTNELKKEICKRFCEMAG